MHKLELHRTFCYIPWNHQTQACIFVQRIYLKHTRTFAYPTISGTADGRDNNSGQVTYWRQTRKGTNLRNLSEIFGVTGNKRNDGKIYKSWFAKVEKGLKWVSSILIKLTAVERPRNFELEHTCILACKSSILLSLKGIAARK